MDSTLDRLDTADDRDHWMAWGGILFLLLFAALLFLGGNEAAEDSAGQKVIDTANEHRDMQYALVFVAGPAVALLLMFMSRLRALLGPLAGAGRHLMQYGAVIYGTAIVLDAVLSLGILGAADHKRPAVAETLNVLVSDDWIIYTLGIGLVLLGAGLAVLRTGLLPRWMGWIAVVVGVVSFIGPGGFAGFMVGPLWIGVASVMLATRKAAPVAAAPAM